MSNDEFWKHAERAASEVDKWPHWKVHDTYIYLGMRCKRCVQIENQEHKMTKKNSANREDLDRVVDRARRSSDAYDDPESQAARDERRAMSERHRSDETEKATGIRWHLKVLSDAIAELEGEQKQLHEVLNPVLMIVPTEGESKCSDKEPPCSDSDVVRTLKSMTARIEYLCSHTRSLESRIDI
jgi:hypothetical protein